MPQVTDPAVTKLQEDMKTLRESMSEMLAMLKKTTSTPPRANNSWFCGPQPNSGPPSPMICHNCKGVGHGYQECPSQRDALSSGTPSQSPSKPTTPSPKLLNGQGLNKLAKVQSINPKANCCPKISHAFLPTVVPLWLYLLQWIIILHQISLR